MTTRLTLRIPTADGTELAGDLFAPAGRCHGSVLVASAMGVPRGYYTPFASFLAEAGLRTLLFDYRGIGGSAPRRLRGFEARLADWADRDLPAAAAALREAGDEPLLYLGHSVGGQLFGLLRGLDVRAALFVGSQSGHWRHWPTWRGKLGIAAFFRILVPAFAVPLGYLPMRALGLGEDLPAGVALEWACWGRERDYVLGWARRERGVEHFDFRRPMRFCAVEDDRFAPPAAVEALRAFFPRARAETRLWRPADLGVPRIGHFGPFRPAFRDSLWVEMRDWLLARAAGVEIGAAIG